MIYSQNTLAVLAPHIPITKPEKTLLNWATLLSPCLRVSDSFNHEHKVNQVSQRSMWDLSHVGRNSEKWWSLRAASCLLLVPSCCSCTSFPTITFQFCGGKYWENEARTYSKSFSGKWSGGEECDSGNSLPWSGAISSWKQWWALAGITQPPSPICHLCWAAHVREQCFHLSLREHRVLTRVLSHPSVWSSLCLKPACSVMLELEHQGYCSAQRWGWQGWAQQVFMEKDFLPFCITGPWAQWVVWLLHSLFCFAFVSTVRFLVHPEVSSSIPVF